MGEGGTVASSSLAASFAPLCLSSILPPSPPPFFSSSSFPPAFEAQTLLALEGKFCFPSSPPFPPIVASLKSFPFPFSADGKTCKRDASLSQDAHIHSCVTLILVRPLKAPGGGIRGLPRSSCHFCHLAFTNFLPPPSPSARKGVKAAW